MKKRSCGLFFALVMCIAVIGSTMSVSAVGAHGYDVTPTSYDPNTNHIMDMYVGTIRNMQTTINSPGKKFVDYELPSGATVYVTGSLTHSITSGYNIKSGACYWDGSIYRAGPVDVTRSGDSVDAKMAVSALEDGETYYGYVKNIKKNSRGETVGEVNGGSICIDCY